MEKVAVDKMMEKVSKHLAKYKKLTGQRAELQERLRKAEEQKHSVRDSIYKKVRDEYKVALKALTADLRPLETTIGEARPMFIAEISDIEKQMKDMQDQLDELAFRHRVGEFDESKLTDRQGPIKKTMKECGPRKDTITAMLAEVEEADGLASDSEPTEQAASRETPATHKVTRAANYHRFRDRRGSETSKQKAPTAKKKQKAPTASKDTPDDPTLVNPGDWMKEFEEESGPTLGRRSSDVPIISNSDSKSKSDPLSTLADPSDENGNKTKSTGVGTKEPPQTFPVLIITKGPGSGKKIPLLPMTMTVGREHDNNIELKDENVARYHARISFQNGEYVMQDMESSSGTWINGKKVTEAALDHGDKVRVGSTEMLVDFE